MKFQCKECRSHCVLEVVTDDTPMACPYVPDNEDHREYVETNWVKID